MHDLCRASFALYSPKQAISRTAASDNFFVLEYNRKSGIYREFRNSMTPTCILNTRIHQTPHSSLNQKTVTT